MFLTKDEVKAIDEVGQVLVRVKPSYEDGSTVSSRAVLIELLEDLIKTLRKGS